LFQSPPPSSAAARAKQRNSKDDHDDEEDDEVDQHGTAIPAPGVPHVGDAALSGLPKDDTTAFAGGATGGGSGDNNNDSSSGEDYSDEVSSDDEEGSGKENENDHNTFRRRNDVGFINFLRQKSPSPWLFIVIGLLGLAFSSSRVRNTLFTLWSTQTVRNICFRDSLNSQDAQDSVQMSHLCVGDDQPILWKECPTDAYCQGGSLLQCPDGFFVHSHGCFLDASSNETLNAVLELLQEWTAVDTCYGNLERFEKYGYGNRPLFHFSRVAGELEMGYNPKLITVGNHSRFLLLSPSKDEIWIGLHPTIKVPLSYSCHAELALVTVCSWINWVVMTAVQILWFVVRTYISALYRYPLKVASATVIVYFALKQIYVKWKARAEKKQLEKDREACWNASLEILSSDPTKGFFIDDLSEKVAWKLHSMSSEGRCRVTKQIMPQLERELRKHQSVKLERNVRNGVPADKLQWVDPAQNGRN
jgi:hypothetical protein